MSIILELIEIITDSSLIKRWLHLLTAKQNDIQNRNKRKQEVPSIHQKPLVSVHPMWKSYIQSMKITFTQCFRVVNALRSRERAFALQPGIIASSHGKYTD